MQILSEQGVTAVESLETVSGEMSPRNINNEKIILQVTDAVQSLSPSSSSQSEPKKQGTSIHE